MSCDKSCVQLKKKKKRVAKGLWRCASLVLSSASFGSTLDAELLRLIPKLSSLPFCHLTKHTKGVDRHKIKDGVFVYVSGLCSLTPGRSNGRVEARGEISRGRMALPWWVLNFLFRRELVWLERRKVQRRDLSQSGETFGESCEKSINLVRFDKFGWDVR